MREFRTRTETPFLTLSTRYFPPSLTVDTSMKDQRRVANLSSGYSFYSRIDLRAKTTSHRTRLEAQQNPESALESAEVGGSRLSRARGHDTPTQRTPRQPEPHQGRTY